jgi:hypothetical protein
MVAIEPLRRLVVSRFGVERIEAQHAGQVPFVERDGSRLA